MTSPFNWQLGQLFAAAGRESEAPRAPPNPRPPGVIQQGSATDVVLHFLLANRGRYFSRVEIIVATGRTEKAVDWGLLFLRREGLVNCVPDEARNPRYLRHGANKESVGAAIRSAVQTRAQRRAGGPAPDQPEYVVGQVSGATGDELVKADTSERVIERSATVALTTVTIECARSIQSHSKAQDETEGCRVEPGDGT